jgi:hypothetical protein
MKIKPRIIQYPMKNRKNNCNSRTRGNNILLIKIEKKIMTRWKLNDL